MASVAAASSSSSSSAAAAAAAADVDGADDVRVGWPAQRPRADPKMHGWFFDTHRRVFAHALKRDVKVILELGSWYGASTEYLAQKAPPGTKVYAVDFWDNRFIVQDQGDHYHDGGTKEGSKVMRMLDRHDLYETFLANLWPYRDTVVPLRMSTLDGVQWLKDRNIVPDVIYIDADHHYEAAKQDIRHSLLAFPDALCVGDDYGNYEGVKNAVLECAQEFKKTVHIDQNHCWAYMRINSDTGSNVTPRPKGGFAGLLKGFKKKDKKKKDKGAGAADGGGGGGGAGSGGGSGGSSGGAKQSRGPADATADATADAAAGTAAGGSASDSGSKKRGSESGADERSDEADSSKRPRVEEAPANP